MQEEISYAATYYDRIANVALWGLKLKTWGEAWFKTACSAPQK